MINLYVVYELPNLIVYDFSRLTKSIKQYKCFHTMSNFSVYYMYIKYPQALKTNNQRKGLAY